MKRKLCSILILTSLILVAFSACGKKDDPVAETAETKQETEPAVTEEPFLEGLDFDNRSITINVRGDEEAIVEIGEESQGDILTEALFQRTRMTEDRLNVKIQSSPQNSYGSYNATIAKLRNSIISNYQEFDLVAGWSPRIVPLITEGLFCDLNSFSTYHSQDVWWSRSVNNALTLNGQLYLTTGDIAATYMDSCYAVIVNQTVANNFQYQYDDFYDVVYSGEWTMEYFYQLVKDAYKDDGNTVRDENDIYGLVCSYTVADCFWASCGLSIIENNGVDYPVLNFDVEKIQNVADAVYNLFYQNVGVSTDAPDNPAIVTDYGKQFMEDKSMFLISKLESLSGYSQMTSTYGVLPTPKYNSTQKEYYSYVQQSMSLWGVPVDALSAEESAAVLTSLGHDSHDIVIEPHYEKLLKLKYVKDSTSGYMIDLIYNGIFMNFDSLFNEALGVSVSAKDRVTMPVFILRTISASTAPNVERWWASNGEGLTERLGTILGKSFG